MRISSKDFDKTKSIVPQPAQGNIPTEKVPQKDAYRNNPSGDKAADTQPVDIVEISTAAPEQHNNAESKRDDMRGRYRTLLDEVKKAQEIGEGMAESMKVMLRCQKIAMRIMMGDNVPPQDERYLAENDIELYTKAKQLRMQKVDPEDYDSLLDDDDDSDGISADEPSSGAVEQVGSNAQTDAGAAPEVAVNSQEPA